MQLPELITGKVRLDTGVQQGDEVSPYYDPMISKLIVWGEDRDQCLSTLKQALQQYQIAGVTTNLSFLRKVVNVDAFQAGDVSTQFIEEFNDQLISDNTVKNHHLIAAVCQHMLKRISLGLNRASSDDISNPWHGLSSMRLNQAAKETLNFQTHDNTLLSVDVVTLKCEGNIGRWQITINNETFSVMARLENDTVQYQFNDKWQSARIVTHNKQLWVYDGQGESQFSYYRSSLSSLLFYLRSFKSY